MELFFHVYRSSWPPAHFKDLEQPYEVNTSCFLHETTFLWSYRAEDLTGENYFSMSLDLAGPRTGLRRKDCCHKWSKASFSDFDKG